MKIDYRHGFVRYAVASPKLRVADTRFNAMQTVEVIKDAADQGVEILVLPELGLTGYTCKDLFHHETLQNGALDALEVVLKASKRLDMLITVGLPLVVEGQLYNCAAVLFNGKVLGVVPKSYPPNYKNFEELRWFQPAAVGNAKDIELFGCRVPFGTNLLFTCSNVRGLVFAVEICEDGWVPVPPGAFYTLFGATVIGNPSASNDVLLKAGYRRNLFSIRSAINIGAYGYASAGVHESSTDMLFGGHVFITENGSILVENKRFERRSVIKVTDVDCGRLLNDRLFTNSFAENRRVMTEMLRPEYTQFRSIPFKLRQLDRTRKLLRKVDGKPFVPKGDELHDRCEEIANIQEAALAQRIETVSAERHTLYGFDGSTDEPTLEQLCRFRAVLGLSGGSDSTLAALIAYRSFKLIGIPTSNVLAMSLPGFGTGSRTRGNSSKLAALLGFTFREVDIRGVCLESMLAENVKPFGIDIFALQAQVEAANQGKSLTELKQLVVEALHEKLRNLPDDVREKGDLRFENLQARERTKILMQNGFVLGTGDLSELAKGWCTYNADHMSMYNVNGAVPKTLVKWVISYMAHNDYTGELRDVLIDIVDTPVSPELLPVGANGEVKQVTEDTVGPYELTDFFLYYLLRFGFTPEKILYLAENAQFEHEYSEDYIRHWLCDFIERFFRQQFKRSALPDGPKVGSISLSPRGDWRMPTDACAALWLSFLDAEEKIKRYQAKAPRPRADIPTPVVTSGATS